jgi:hypothetical protein
MPLVRAATGPERAVAVQYAPRVQRGQPMLRGDHRAEPGEQSELGGGEGEVLVQQPQHTPVPVGDPTGRSGHGSRRRPPPRRRRCVIGLDIHRVWHRNRAYHGALTSGDTPGTRQAGAAALGGLPNGIPIGIPS